MEGKSRRKGLLTTVIVALCIAAVIIMNRTFGNRRYYITSIVIMVLSIIPFLFSFERRKPKPMEFVVLFVLCGIGILSRVIFTAFPAFKPMTAVIIITGMAFGPQSGFLTGVMTLFLSNYFFGQGPWTPWQMVAFGFAGFISGLLAEKGVLPKNNKNIIAIYGYALVQLVIGPFLDLCSFLTSFGMAPTTTMWDLLKSGFSYNMVHAVAVALFLLLLYNPIMDKLERIKIKYGMMEDEAQSFEDIFGEEKKEEAEDK